MGEIHGNGVVTGKIHDDVVGKGAISFYCVTLQYFYTTLTTVAPLLSFFDQLSASLLFLIIIMSATF